MFARGDRVFVSGSHPEWCPQGIAPFYGIVERVEGGMVGIYAPSRNTAVNVRPALCWYPESMVHRAVNLEAAHA